MFKSVLVRRWQLTGPQRRGGHPRHGARGFIGAICAAVTAGIAFATAGLAGAGIPAVAAAQSLGPPLYNIGGQAGYVAQGRWFRFVSTTLTVPPRTVPKANFGGAVIAIHASCPGQCGPPYAQILVEPGGGPSSVSYQGFFTGGSFRVSPQVGDKLAISIYYDQRGHDYFTATDLTQHTTQTVRLRAGGIDVVYNRARLFVAVGGTVQPPAADTRLWDFTGSHLTTYTGVHGTILGPWTTSKMIGTSTGTSTGTVVDSPSGLSTGGQDFGAWLRALPLSYTQATAGYADSGGPFRFIATTLTVPAAQAPSGNGGSAQVTLLHNGGPTPRPNANIGVLPGGGAGSISYTSNAASGTFTVSPNVGDQLAVSIYYDQHGHYLFTVNDTTQGTTQTVQVNALYADQMPLNSAMVLGVIDNSAVSPPPTDIRLWQFTGSRVTTYSGAHGSIPGPWATSESIDTTDGTAAGAVVMSPSVLSNGGQNFDVWLRHQ